MLGTVCWPTPEIQVSCVRQVPAKCWRWDVGVGGAKPRIAQRRARPATIHDSSGFHLALFEMFHVEIARGFEPTFVDLSGKCPHQRIAEPTEFDQV